MSLDPDWYLRDMYAPVSEEVTAFDLPVIGELPEQLCGRYVRNGPNPIGEVDPARHHWFVGDGMVHGVRLDGGRAAWYRNRYVGSTAVSAARGLADVDGPNWNGSVHGPNTNVAGFAGTTWAVVEAGACPVELTDELETVARNDFFGTLPGGFTAHPKLDPRRGDLHAVCYAYPQWFDHVQYVVVDADGRVRRTVDVPVDGMPMIHDMSLTDRYAVIYDMPVTVDVDMVGQRSFPFAWDPDHGSRLGLLPREGEADDMVWIDAPLGYVFHPMNAYDTTDGSVIIDVCRYERIFATDTHGPFGDGFARLERWQLDPRTRCCTATVIDPRPIEFPRHRGSLSGRPYRYAYAVEPSLDDGWPTVKFDLRSGEREVFDHGRGRVAGEPVFVSRCDPTAEDDGWLINFVHDHDRAELVVLDAQDLRRGPVARVPLPQRIPLGFHGNWIPDG